MADPVLIAGGGRTGETLLILGLLGAGAFILWRKGAFARPEPLAAAAGPIPPPAPAPVPPPVMSVATAPASPVRPPSPPRKQWTTETAAAAAPVAQVAAVAAPELLVKPPPVTAAPGTVATVVANIPSPFGKKPVAMVSTKPPPVTVTAPPVAKASPPPAVVPAPPMMTVAMARPAATSLFKSSALKPAPLGGLRR